MNRLNIVPVIAAVLLSPHLSALAADLPPVLNHNPFKPPARIAQRQGPFPGKSRAADLELRATLITKEWTMANVNGTMLVPGDTINGYRLRQIRENEVVFVKDGVQVVVTIDDAHQP